MNTIYILNAIKSELKKAKITYRDLAQELKITEAGVKKILSRNDISLKRAIEICKAINTPFSEVLSLAENNGRGQLRFTDKQVTFFKKNISFFYFYMKLAYEQRTPLQIQAELGLSLKSLNTYLKKLEEQDLIKRHPKDRTQIVGGIPLEVSTGGTELESVKFDITEKLLALMKSSREGSLYGAGLYLTQDQAQELKEKLMGLMNSYSITSSANRKNSKVQARPNSVMIVQSPLSMFNSIQDL